MTWDVYALRAPRGARSVEQIPEGYVGPAVGSPEDVLDAVRQAAPHVDAQDPRWLRIDGPDHQLEIALGKGVRVQDLSFFIARGDGAAVAIVLAVCRSLGITPFDTETGEVLTPDSRPPAEAPADDADEDQPPWWRRIFRR